MGHRSVLTFLRRENVGIVFGVQSLHVRRQNTILTELFQVLSELMLAFLILEVRYAVAQLD